MQVLFEKLKQGQFTSMVFLFRVLKEIANGLPLCETQGQVSCQILVFFFSSALIRNFIKENILQSIKPKKKAETLEPKISLIGV